MAIIMDDREPKEHATSLRRRRCDLTVKRIEVGDYLLENGIAIERKDGGDFIGSIQDGRIWSQASNLIQYEHPMICIIENNVWKKFYYSKSNYVHKSYFGTIGKLSTKFGISVLMFADEDDFLVFVAQLDKQQAKKGKSSRPAPMLRRPTSMKVRKENSLCGAENVSVKTAKDILKELKTLKKVANAKVERLEKIEGVGPKTAQNIYKLYNEK
jgi:Fanconi anemia group M protein